MSVGPGVLRIGEVHAQLRREYPDIELSKIRYYEDKGLVRPARSRKGYRLYSDRDVECLREAIRLAQEEFVPLRVVRLRLIEQGLLDSDGSPVVPAPTRVARDAGLGAVQVNAPVSRPVLRVVDSERASEGAGTTSTNEDVESTDRSFALPTITTRKETPPDWLSAVDLLSATGLEAASFNDLQAAGILKPEVRSGATLFRASDVLIGSIARRLLERGIDVRHLSALRRVAEREAGIVDDMVRAVSFATQQRDAGDRARVDVSNDVVELQAMLVKRELGD